jgi:hypothetical protein
MSGGRIFDRPGYPPVDRPPPPGTVLRPLKVTRLAQAVTALALTLSSLAILPHSTASVVVPLAAMLAGLLRTRSLRRDQVESVDYWLVRWRTSKGHVRRWQLWPYWRAGIMWPGVAMRSDEVMDCLISLVESWADPPQG